MIARGAHDFLQPVGTYAAPPGRRFAQGVRASNAEQPRPPAQIAFGNRHGNGSHFLEVSDNIVEVVARGADLIVASHVNVLIESPESPISRAR